MDNKGKSILIGSGIAALGLAAGFARHAAVDRLDRIAFDRECPAMPNPKNRRRVQGSAEDPIFSAKLYQCARRLRQQPMETVYLTAKDGRRLVGHWWAHPNAERVIVAMHGWRSSWDNDFGMAADFFRKQNCSVLFVEQRAQNSSEGDCIGFGVLERHDCLSWIKWVIGKTERKLPVYLAGVSMGATTVMLTAGLELPKEVKGIVADCGFTSIHDISQHVIKNNLRLHYGVGPRTVDSICRKRLQVGAKEHTTAEALKNANVPILIVHGTEDAFVPVSMAYENYKACKGPKELLIVPGADHGMSYYLNRKGYESALLGFWKEHDH